MNKNLIKEVESLIAYVDKTHRYSMSDIYGLYNQVFGTNEAPQSCASCLIRKRDELKKWLEAEREKLKEIERSVDVHSTPLGNEKLEAAKPTTEGDNKPKRKRKNY